MSAAADLAPALADVQKGVQALLTVLEALSGTKAASSTPAAGTAAASSTSVTVQAGVVTDVSAVADTITAGEKLALFVTQAKNTPAMVTAAEKQARQDFIDRFNAALEAKDTPTIRKMIAGL